MQRVIISDASCLILLEKIQLLQLLQQLYTVVTITPEVREEYNTELPQWIVTQSPVNINYQKILEVSLGLGEASSIALAIENENSLLIIDDLKGRKYAQRMNLDVIGTLGLLIVGKQNGYISSVKDCLDKIETTNFRLSPALRRIALTRAGEIADKKK